MTYATIVTSETGILKNYFHSSLTEICDRRNIDSSNYSIAYVVNLLCQYARSDQVFDWDKEMGYDIRPLALLYGDAIQTKNRKQRLSILRRMGDVALFISGLFSASLSRKPVGVDYYINMGGGAYGWLSESLEKSGNDSLDQEVFRELSERFTQFVTILDEFVDSTQLRGNQDLVSMYESWLEDHDPRMANKIIQMGMPYSDANTRSTH